MNTNQSGDAATLSLIEKIRAKHWIGDKGGAHVDLCVVEEIIRQQQPSLIEKLERAVMLIETAWMDIEPIPVEIAARDLIKEVIAVMGGASTRKDEEKKDIDL